MFGFLIIEIPIQIPGQESVKMLIMQLTPTTIQILIKQELQKIQTTFKIQIEIPIQPAIG